MSEAILAAAKELIKSKKYEEARTILLTIKDDPTAVKWLERLNERIGEQSRQWTTVDSAAVVPRENVERRGYTIHTPKPDPVSNTPYSPPPPPSARHENVGMARVFRWVWGILLLLTLLWLGNAFLSLGEITNESLQQAENSRNIEAAQAGTIIGSGIGLTTILCIGMPFFIFFGLMYWRNGVAIREARRHQQTVEAMRGR